MIICWIIKNTITTHNKNTEDLAEQFGLTAKKNNQTEHSLNRRNSQTGEEAVSMRIQISFDYLLREIQK